MKLYTNPKPLFMVFLVVLGITPCHAADKDFSPPSDSQKVWKAGFAEFFSETLSLENRYLKSSLPLLLIERLGDCDEHLLSAEEIENYRTALLEEEVRKHEKTLGAEWSKRDALLFSPDKKNRDKNYKIYTEKIAASRAEIEYLSSLETVDIPVEETKPISFWEGNLEGTLIGFEGINHETLTSENDLDLLVYGYLEEIEDYIFIDVRAYSGILKRVVFRYEDAAVREDLALVVTALSKDLATVLLGREWASLTIVPNPSDGVIFIDGELAGIGRTTVSFLKPGKRTVMITAPGHDDARKEIELNVQEERVIEITAPAKILGDITINSIPDGADVFVGSVWSGRTPAVIGRPEKAKQLILRLEGYEEKRHVLSPLSPEELSFTLSGDLTDWVQEIEKKKNAFYTSFGLFVISIPLPVIFYASAQNSFIGGTEIIESGNYESIDRLEKQKDRFLVLYFGGIGISGGLFVNMIYRLFDYIRSGEKLHY